MENDTLTDAVLALDALIDLYFIAGFISGFLACAVGVALAYFASR